MNNDKTEYSEYFEPMKEVQHRGGFRDESSHLYVVNFNQYLFLFPEEEFNKFGSIDRKTIWDTMDFVIANNVSNDTKEDDENEFTFDMYDLITISHTIPLPPITLKVDLSLDDVVTGGEFDTLRDNTPYHVYSNVMKRSGEYLLFVEMGIYKTLDETSKDKLIDNIGYIAWSGCDKHEWFIETEHDLINFNNIIFIDMEANFSRKNIINEIEARGGFRDKTGEYILYAYPCTFVFPEWFENIDTPSRENIYNVCAKIANDDNRPNSDSTGSLTYNWDDVMALMGRYYDYDKHYDGPGDMEQLIERETNDGKLYTVDTTTAGWVSFNSNFNINALKVNVKSEVWNKLQPTEHSPFMKAFEYMLVAHKEAKIYRQFCWNLTTSDSVYYFTKYALDDPLSLAFRVVIDNDVYRAYDKVSISSAVFDFTTCNVESFLFVIGSDNFFSSLSFSNMSAINNEIDRISKLSEEERYLEFGAPLCSTFYYNCGKFSTHKPDQIIPELEGADTMIGGFDGTTFYVTDNDEIVKENIYEDEVRGERCKILKFSAKHNGIYFFSIEMAAWNALDAVIEDMLITKARIVSKIGCSSHIWHFNSVGAVEEFLNIPVKDEKNLLGLNKPNPIKEENTMFDNFPFFKKNNDNLPKKEANPTMPTPEQAKVILDAMYACQADTSQYAEEMRRNRARANATIARAVLTHGILTGDQMAFRNLKLPKDVKYPYATRMADGELVVVTNGKSSTEQILNTTNSVPVTNLQDYANILGTLDVLKEQSEHGGLTAEEAASVVTNYIACRDQSLLEMLQDTNSLEKVIGENTVKEIENTEFDNLMITTSPTVMKYITIMDEDDKK